MFKGFRYENYLNFFADRFVSIFLSRYSDIPSFHFCKKNQVLQHILDVKPAPEVTKLSTGFAGNARGSQAILLLNTFSDAMRSSIPLHVM